MPTLSGALFTQWIPTQLRCSQLSPSVGGVEATGLSVPVAGIVFVVNDRLVLLTICAITQCWAAGVSAWGLRFPWHVSVLSLMEQFAQLILEDVPDLLCIADLPVSHNSSIEKAPARISPAEAVPYITMIPV